MDAVRWEQEGRPGRRGEGSGAVKTGSLKRATEMRQGQEQQAAAATVVAESRGSSSKAAPRPLPCGARSTDAAAAAAPPGILKYL